LWKLPLQLPYFGVARHFRPLGNRLSDLSCEWITESFRHGRITGTMKADNSSLAVALLEAFVLSNSISRLKQL